jgi:uncharacterized repeat protein (TIGR02543 family)
MNCHGGFELDGSLDQYKVWSGILTVDQIKQTRFSTTSERISGSVPTLRAYYDFNYSSAPAAIADKTGSGYDLSYTAGTATHPISSRPLVPFFSINAADTNSYPGSGTTVTDLSSNQYSGNLGSATFDASDKTFNLGNNTPITFTDASTYKADLTNGISIQFAADINVTTSNDWDIIFDFGTNQSTNYSRMQFWNKSTTRNLSYYSIRSGTAYECRISGISSGMKMYSFNIDETGCTVQIDGSSVTTTVPLATYKAATPTTSSAWTLRVGSAIGGLNGIDGKLKSLVISSGTSEIRTVQFDPNSGSGSMANQQSSVSTPLNSNGFSRSGYRFAGWNSKADGTGTNYTNQESFAFTTSVILYAKWELANSTVTFNANDGSGSPTTTTQVVSDGVSTALMANTFTRSNYQFIGWNTLSNATGTTYLDQSSITTSSSLVLYAIWQADSDLVLEYSGSSFNSTSSAGGVVDMRGNSNGSRIQSDG